MTDSGTEDSLQASWLDDPKALGSLEAEWRDLAIRTSAEVYLTPTWILVWLRHFMQDRGFACLVLRKNGRLVGLLPFCLDHLWIGPMRLRVARFAGTDPHCIVFRLPVEQEVLDEALDHSVNHLIRSLRCDVISFTPVSERARYLPVLADVIGRNRDLMLQAAPEGTHVVFDLPENFASFLGRLSKKRRSQLGRDIIGLCESFQMEARQITPDAAAFAAFEAFHTHQWQAVGRGGHFVDWPGSSDFYRDLADQPMHPHLVQLHELSGPKGSLATQFALVAGDTAHWRLPARSLDPEAERLSAGKAGLLKMIEALIQQGITQIEAGRGDYGYKLSYGGKSIPVQRLLISSTQRRARVRLLLMWADLINYIYYRIWFLKVVPILAQRAGRRPRPLWRSWIRSRI